MKESMPSAEIPTEFVKCTSKLVETVDRTV